ncbi:hypothetical protein OAO87_04100 [bacterium]|nr:hypothetical protein [bacterium]
MTSQVIVVVVVVVVVVAGFGGRSELLAGYKTMRATGREWSPRSPDNVHGHCRQRAPPLHRRSGSRAPQGQQYSPTGRRLLLLLLPSHNCDASLAEK